LADVSIAANKSYKQIAVERGGMDPDRVFVVRSGPDLSRTRRVPANPACKQGRKYMVGYVGGMGAQEGLDYLLDGAAWLVHELKRQDIQFVLVGGGTELAVLKQMAREKKIDDFVTFTDGGQACVIVVIGGG
jgi:glycosyltransferase involved in cell wall biosynthesis